MYIATLSILLWVIYSTYKGNAYLLAYIYILTHIHIYAYMSIYIYILIRVAPSTLGTFRFFSQSCFRLAVLHGSAFQSCPVSGWLCMIWLFGRVVSHYGFSVVPCLGSALRPISAFQLTPPYGGTILHNRKIFDFGGYFPLTFDLYKTKIDNIVMRQDDLCRSIRSPLSSSPIPSRQWSCLP